MKRQKGISLIEILVVITIFAVLGVITTRSVLLTLQGTKKTEAIVRVRENLNYAMGAMERQIRNAESVPSCPNSDKSVLNYLDNDGNSASYTCTNIGTGDGYLASGSARLTNSAIDIITCQLNCIPSSANTPSAVQITLTGTDKNAAGIPGATVSVFNTIYLRNY